MSTGVRKLQYYLFAEMFSTWDEKDTIKITPNKEPPACLSKNWPLITIKKLQLYNEYMIEMSEFSLVL